jgi:thiol-disulfide isomerase/thioredoxin
MSKAARNRQGSARARIAAQQAAARRAERRNRLFIAGGSLVAVVAILVAFIVIKLNSGSPAGPAPAGARISLPAVARDVTSIPAGTLDQAGPGSLPKSPLIRAGGPALASGGQPEVLYIGAEYCPFCAAERWALVVALSRFGSFSGLRFIHSSAAEQPPVDSLPTMTFYQSRYVSKYLTFSPVETQTASHAALEALSAQQQQIFSKYDAPPYVAASAQQTIPFTDFGNRFLTNGASYDASLLHGKTWQQVAAALRDPASPIGQGALGTANYLTAAICRLTADKPASVCASQAISSLAGRL